MITVAIIGANGFIGTRTVEMLHLGGLAAVRPVVRTASSFARLSRFNIDARVADARSERALSEALAGCEVVVHAASGSPDTIVSTVEPVYNAAQRAGARRLIYLSSASVHGQDPPPRTQDNSPLRFRQPLAYNRAKIRAERTLHQLRGSGNVEIVILRPGIVFGPRSQWIGNFADGLLASSAYLVDGGRGVCNSIYVDNLVHAIIQSMHAERADGEAFLVGDREHVTWRELYAPVARCLGYDLDSVPSVDPAIIRTWQTRFEHLRHSKRARALATLLPAGIRDVLSARLRHSSSSRITSDPLPRASLEMTLLHTCRYKLPSEKAERLLSYNPVVSFNEGCRRTVSWLAFAGYPVVDTSECIRPTHFPRPDLPYA